MRRTWVTFTALGALISLAGCAAILGLEPTDVVSSGNGGSKEAGPPGDGSEGSGDGSGGGDAPDYNPNCASAIRAIDANGEAANAIVADENGVFWSLYEDSSSSLIWSNQTGENKVVVGSNDSDHGNDQPPIIGLALDGTNLYWSAWDTYTSGQLAHVRSSPRAGGTIVEASMPTPGVGEVTLAHGSLWFGNWKQPNGHVYSLPVPFANNAAPFDQSGAGILSPLHFASNEDFVFYDESTDTPPNDQNEIGAVSTTVGGPDEVGFSLTHVEDLAVGAANRVYYAQTNASKIGFAAPNGDASVGLFAAVPYPHSRLRRRSPVSVCHQHDHRKRLQPATLLDERWRQPDAGNVRR